MTTQFDYQSPSASQPASPPRKKSVLQDRAGGVCARIMHSRERNRNRKRRRGLHLLLRFLSVDRSQTPPRSLAMQMKPVNSARVRHRHVMAAGLQAAAVQSRARQSGHF